MPSRQRVHAEALFHDGNRHLQAGDFSAAEDCFRQAVARVPDFAQAWANLGFLLDQKGDLEQAEACYRQSLGLDPACSQVHLNLGALLASQGRYEAALAAYSEAIAHNPYSAACWSNLGALHIGMKREDEAEAFLRKALELDSGFSKARFNLSYLLLRQGRFEEGWLCLEARDWYRALANHLSCPRWQGEALERKSLLIGYEAGHGDVIQFSRYASVLKAQGAHITLICHPALKTLLATLDGVDQVLAFDEDIPTTGWDYWTPLLSIPFHLKTRQDSIPAEIPYLHASADLTAQWKAKLPRGKLRVGLVWKGNPQFENDADRSLPRLELLAPLATVPGVCFVSLQKGAGEDEAQRPPAGFPLVHLGSQMRDFADAAAIVAQLDLVISVDTAMAHLAGALGKPCWLLLPDFMTDWRWQTERSDSLWYPGVMRLFRQPHRGDWASVVARMAVELEAFARNRPASATE